MLMMAHYDSVNNSSGAGDDMAAIAALSEVMRQIKSMNFDNDIIFLFTDGEEEGLLGADAFVRHHPYIQHVGIVINFEGRGNSGPSMLYETGPGNSAMLKQYFQHSKAANGSSLYDEVYKHMPNSTDFTMFRKVGLNGLNFAFADAPIHYHAKIDTVENLNKNSMAHHGQNALDAIAAFGNVNISIFKTQAKTTETMVFFDLYSSIYVYWDAQYSWIGIVFCIIGFILLLTKQTTFSPKKSLVAIVAGVASMFLFLAFSIPLILPISIWPDLPDLDHAAPLAPRLTLLFFTLTMATLASYIFKIKFMINSLDKAIWFIFITLLLPIQFYAAGTIYMLLIPCCTYIISALISQLTQNKFRTISDLLLIIVTAYFSIAFIRLLELAFSFHIVPLLLIAMLPLFAALLTYYNSFDKQRLKFSLKFFATITTIALIATTQITATF